MTRPLAIERSATIYDVAALAGVSHQTVSRYMQGYEGIHPKTRERVRAAVQALKYSPNLTARSLNTGKSHRIVVLTQEITQVGPGKILEGAIMGARQAGYVLDVISLDIRDPSAIKDSIRIAMQYDLAGVLGLTSTDAMNAVFGSTDFKVPTFVAVNGDELGQQSINSAGFLALLAYLKKLGHNDVMHFAGSPIWVAARNRVKEYEAAVKDLGMHSVAVIYGDWSAKSGYAAVKSLEGNLKATAILAANDQIALGTILALKEDGYSVPQDISVTGIDDNPDSAFYSPPLTTSRLDFHGEGRHAIHRLISLIKNAEAPAFTTNEPDLIIRDSTSIARKII